MKLDIQDVRSHFSAFAGENAPVYFDSAATAQTPDDVIDAMDEYYRTYCANVHRGMHALTEQATLRYEDARKTVGKWIGAKFTREIVFTKNCTEAINLVARTWGDANLDEGDVIAVSLLEHHSNIVPWQQLAERKGAKIEWIEIDNDGQLKMDSLDEILSGGKVKHHNPKKDGSSKAHQKNNAEPGVAAAEQSGAERSRVKLVAVTGQSNVLGTRPDIKAITQKAHDAGALVLIDAAQLIGHHTVDVQDVDCDFLAFSGHKLYGPTGVGVLYAKRDLLEEMPPFLGGGMMIHEVKKDGFSPAESPQKFEAGTPPIAQAIGLAAAIDWLGQFSWEDIEKHEEDLLKAARKMLESIDDLTLFGPKDASGCISFVTDGAHPHDLTDILGQKHIALRAGHHCTQPLHEKLGVPATTRLSVGIYNTVEEIHTVKEGMQKALELLRS